MCRGSNTPSRRQRVRLWARWLGRMLCRAARFVLQIFEGASFGDVRLELGSGGKCVTASEEDERKTFGWMSESSGSGVFCEGTSMDLKVVFFEECICLNFHVVMASSRSLQHVDYGRLGEQFNSCVELLRPLIPIALIEGLIAQYL